MESVENCVQTIKDHFKASVTFVAFLSRNNFLKEAFDLSMI